MKNDLITLIKEAGNKIMNFHGDIKFQLKKDGSPLTLADKLSHDYLCKNLLQIKNIPIISEENSLSYNLRKSLIEYWLIDPLDGTKEFLKGYDDFCINIALIKNHKPILGLIYAPKLNELYYAEQNLGFEYLGPKYFRNNDSRIIIASSRFHHSKISEEFMRLNGFETSYTIGAAIKFGRMALGLVDVYPRFEGSKEWDTAAGQIIIIEANYKITDLISREPPKYNKKNLKNNYFIAYKSEYDINQFKFPSYI